VTTGAGKAGKLVYTILDREA